MIISWWLLLPWLALTYHFCCLFFHVILICVAGHKWQYYWLKIILLWESMWILLLISTLSSLSPALCFNTFALECFSPALSAFPIFLSNTRRNHKDRQTSFTVTPSVSPPSALPLDALPLFNESYQEGIQPHLQSPSAHVLTPAVPHGYSPIAWLLIG